MDLNSILTIIGIISPFILATVWMTTLIARISNRALLLEVARDNHEERLTKVEAATDYAVVEKTVEKICKQIFNSIEFKESIEKTVKSAVLHVERNNSAATMGSLTLVLDEIKQLHREIIDQRHNHHS